MVVMVMPHSFVDLPLQTFGLLGDDGKVYIQLDM